MSPDLVYAYNHSVHHSIKMKPALVNSENENRVWHVLYDKGFDDVRPVKYKFKVGNQVRISKTKRKFEKGYMPNFSKEIFNKKICLIKTNVALSTKSVHVILFT